MKKFVLFDFDGVILDSFTPAFTVAKMICPNTTPDSYRSRFEGNIFDNLYKDVHDDRCRHDIDFFSEYIPRMKQESKVFDGISDVIRTLAVTHSLIIISSTITTPIIEVLQANNLQKYFLEVMGADIHKSKVEKMKMVFEKYGTTADCCVFVTDTLGDIREAGHHGVPVVAVSWGFHSHATLVKGQPEIIVDSPVSLVDAVHKIFNQ